MGRLSKENIVDIVVGTFIILGIIGYLLVTEGLYTIHFYDITQVFIISVLIFIASEIMMIEIFRRKKYRR